MTAIRTIIAVGWALLLIGCTAGPDLSGAWEGERDVVAVPGSDPIIVRQLSRIQLTVRPDGSADLIDGGVPKTCRTSQTGQGTILTVESIANVPIDHQDPETQSRYRKGILLTPGLNHTVTFEDLGVSPHETITLKRIETRPRRRP